MVLGPGGKKLLKTYARVGAVGIELALSTVLGLLGGQWLDGRFDTTPFLTILGLLLGLTAGFRSLVRTARHASSSNADRGDSAGPPSDDEPKHDG
ncbi:MAG: AtpZ/AtpI family protein [Myxococcales bacterium]|nr:AtpZ/AtpI family protein [Myxococcales bacterium]MDD9971286.1 AtpZ/AtpI family protein [Myxococcales bacterium]